MEAFKGSSNPKKGKDDPNIGCATRVELGSFLSKLGNNGERASTKGEKALDLGSVLSKVNEGRSSFEKGPSGKAASKRDQSTRVGDQGKKEQGSKASCDQQGEAPSPMPGYMQSTQSTKAKARQTSSTCSMSPAKRQEGSPASAGKRRSSPSPGSDPKQVGLDTRLPSPSSQRLISHVRTSSSRTLLSSFKDQNMHAANETQVK